MQFIAQPVPVVPFNFGSIVTQSPFQGLTQQASGFAGGLLTLNPMHTPHSFGSLHSALTYISGKSSKIEKWQIGFGDFPTKDRNCGSAQENHESEAIREIMVTLAR